MALAQAISDLETGPVRHPKWLAGANEKKAFVAVLSGWKDSLVFDSHTFPTQSDWIKHTIWIELIKLNLFYKLS